MDNKKAIKHREKLPKLNNFIIKDLREMPEYFGWVNYVVNENISFRVQIMCLILIFMYSF